MNRSVLLAKHNQIIVFFPVMKDALNVMLLEIVLMMRKMMYVNKVICTNNKLTHVLNVMKNALIVGKILILAKLGVGIKLEISRKTVYVILDIIVYSKVDSVIKIVVINVIHVQKFKEPVLHVLIILEILTNNVIVTKDFMMMV